MHDSLSRTEFGRSNKDIIGFLAKHEEEITTIQIFVGTEFVQRNPDEDVYLWIRANLLRASGTKNRPHREYMVGVFEQNNCRDPIAKAYRDAKRLSRLLARHGYEVEVL